MSPFTPLIPGDGPETERTSAPGNDPAVSDWQAALGRSTSAQLRETQTAFEDTVVDLQRTQAALAASQADLTRTKEELHDALRRAADLEQVREELRVARLRNEGDLEDIQELTSDLFALRENERIRAQTIRDLIAERDEARAEAREMRTQRDRYAEREQALRGELASAMRDLNRAETDCGKQRRERASLEQDLEHTRFERDTERTRREWWQRAAGDVAPCMRCGEPILPGQDIEAQPGTTKGSFRHVHCPTVEQQAERGQP